jgi:hypothetical protein
MTNCQTGPAGRLRQAMAGALAGTAVLAAGGCSLASGSPPGSGEAGSGAAYRGPSWASYLDTSPGRTCTLQGSLSAGVAGSILSTLAQTVISRTRASSGEVVTYRIQTAAISSLPAAQGGAPPMRTSLTVPYEILDNGELGVTPSADSLGDGLEVTFRGFQLYPGVAELKTGRAVTSALSGYLTGTTLAGRNEAAQMTPDGKPLKFLAEFSVSGTAAGGIIRTPAGTYAHLVAVRVSLARMTALNALPAVKKAFSTAGGLQDALGATRLYFARGTGLVEADSGGFAQLLTRCTT